jgi:hypothetical protein
MSDEQKELAPRIGTFLLVLGVFFFILFLVSDFAKQPDFDWLFLGVLLAAVGFIFRRRAAPPPSAGRFSGLNKYLAKRKERRANKGKKKE